MRAVCITGMHRSGTSLLSRVLNLLGVELGPRDQLMPEPGPYRPKGYWELVPIVDLNDELLAAHGGSWDDPPTLADGWELSSDLDELRQKAGELVVNHFGNAPLIGWKDPRTSLTLPFWRTVAPIDRTILMMRPPAEVAASLARRYGWSPERSARLWLRYVVAARRAEPDALVIDYRRFDEPLEGIVDELAGFVGVEAPGEETRAEIAEFFESSLNHYRGLRPPRGREMELATGVFELIVKKPSAEVVDPLFEWLHGHFDTEAAATRALDAARSDVVARDDALAQLRGDLRAAIDEREQLTRRLATADQDLAATSAESERLRADLGSLTEERERLAAAVAAAEEQARAGTAAQDRLQADLDGAVRERDELAAERERLAAEATAIEDRLRTTAAEREGMAAEVATLDERLRSRHDELDRLRATIESVTADRDRLTADRDRLTAEADERSAEVESVTADRDRLAAVADERSAEVESVSAERDRLAGVADDRSAELDGLRAERDRLAGVADDRSAELDGLRAELDDRSAGLDGLRAELERDRAVARALQGQLDELRRERDTAVRQHDRLRWQHDALREAARVLRADQRRLNGWLRSLSVLSGQVFLSRRWRLAGLVGAAGGRRKEGREIEARFAEVFDTHRTWDYDRMVRETPELSPPTLDLSAEATSGAAPSAAVVERDPDADLPLSPQPAAPQPAAPESKPAPTRPADAAPPKVASPTPAPPETAEPFTAEAADARLQAAYVAFQRDVETPDTGHADGPTVRCVVVAGWCDESARLVALLGPTLDAATACVDAVSVALRDAPEPVVSTVLESHRDLETFQYGEGELGVRLGERSSAWPEELVILLAPGDVVANGLKPSLARAVTSVDSPPAAIVFDDDVIDETGVRSRPRFKPAFSPDYLLEHDYVGRAVAFRRETVAEVGGFGTFDHDLPRDLLLRLHDQQLGISKVDRVLVHQRVPAPASGREFAARRVAFAEQTLRRRGLAGVAEVVAHPWATRVSYHPVDRPLVSIIVPFRDRLDLLTRCVDSILRLTTYDRYELLLVDNASAETETLEYLETIGRHEQVRVVRYDAPFNYSRLNNWAVDQATGELLVFLNNDVQVLSAEWLEELVGYACLDGVGMVGGLLHYGDGRIQHGGVVVGLSGFADHAYRGHDEVFVAPELIRYARNWSAVTAACAAVRRDRFDEVGRFNEAFRVTGNDVELGLRFTRAGYRNVLNPAVRLFHFEKQSRSAIPVDEGDQRLSLFYYQPWLDAGDPYWNSNLSRRSTLPMPRTGPEPTATELRRKLLASRSEQSAVRRDVAEIGFLRRYDASSEDLEANAKVMARFAQEREVELTSATWFMPNFPTVYRGGVHTILRFAQDLSRHHGTFNRLVLHGGEIDLADIDGQIRAAFPDLRFESLALERDVQVADLPESDIAICTLWNSAYELLRYNRCRGKFYFLQDDEPTFYAAGSMSGLIEQTFRFGFVGLANTPAVCDMYRAYGNSASFFFPAVDRSIFHPPARERTGDVRRIVWYGRPGKARNAFELGGLALTEVKRRFGSGVEIVAAGADFAEEDFELEDVLTNLGVLPDLASVADVYRTSDIGLVFMFSRHPSYQPLEYMASGCATVTNFNESNAWLFRDGVNVRLAPPTLSGVADAISELVENDALRRTIVQGGLETIGQTTWDAEFEHLRRFVRTGQERDG